PAQPPSCTAPQTLALHDALPICAMYPCGEHGDERDGDRDNKRHNDSGLGFARTRDGCASDVNDFIVEVVCLISAEYDDNQDDDQESEHSYGNVAGGDGVVKRLVGVENVAGSLR